MPMQLSTTAYPLVASVQEGNRIVIPKEARRVLNVTPGDMIRAEIRKVKN